MAVVTGFSWLPRWNRWRPIEVRRQSYRGKTCWIAALTAVAPAWDITIP